MRIHTHMHAYFIHTGVYTNTCIPIIIYITRYTDYCVRVCAYDAVSHQRMHMSACMYAHAYMCIHACTCMQAPLPVGNGTCAHVGALTRAPLTLFAHRRCATRDRVFKLRVCARAHQLLCKVRDKWRLNFCSPKRHFESGPLHPTCGCCASMRGPSKSLLRRLSACAGERTRACDSGPPAARPPKLVLMHRAAHAETRTLRCARSHAPNAS